jgi:SAM-dependent methyltransferase
MKHTSDYFDALFEVDADPWRFKSRWYEQRKRALTLACLPKLRYECAYEPGCANGELSAALAARCDHLLVTDGSQRAVDLAISRLTSASNVEVQQAWVPAEWPNRTFDLIVLSEFCFYLGAEDLDSLAQRAVASLLPGGTVLACHWRWPIAGCEFTGDEVHQRLTEGLALPQVSHLLEPDMRLDVWCHDARSVAQHEGFA